MISQNGPLRIGIGGPVGSGKTTVTEMLCKALRHRYSIAVVTNDIYTKEDALILTRRDRSRRGSAHNSTPSPSLFVRIVVW